MENRYAAQERFAPWGPDGQTRLRRAKALVVGVGGLGGTAAMLLARAGVGSLRLVDPDRPALDNLHRQVLFSEADVAAGLPKVEAGAAYLRSLNHDVAIETKAEALSEDNARTLLGGVNVVLDGLDSGPARHVLNRACLEAGVPLIHAGVVKARGQLLVVRPGQGPCLACWFPGPGQAGESSAVAGIIGPAPAALAAMQAAEALKVLVGDHDSLLKGLLLVDLWPPSFRVVRWGGSGRETCPVCGGSWSCA